MKRSLFFLPAILLLAANLQGCGASSDQPSEAVAPAAAADVSEAPADAGDVTTVSNSSEQGLSSGS